MRAFVFAAAAAAVCIAAPAAADSTKPADRAAKLLAAQAKLIDDRDAALADTFAPDAVLLTPDARRAHDDNDIVDRLRQTSPHETIQSVTVGPVTSGGDDTMVWLASDLAIKIYDTEPEQKPSWMTAKVRVVELMTADANWKVVAAAFTVARAPQRSAQPGDPIVDPTDAGSLSPLLASAAALDGALATSGPVVVLGTDADERGIGAKDAHALLAKWKKLDLSLEGNPREVHGKTWAFALADVNLKAAKDPESYRMSAIVIAVPGAKGAWSVVAACYASL